MDAFLDALQWPAMAVTLLAAWLVAARSAARRRWGFGVFVASNLLWSAWGLHTQAYALIVLQVGLFLLNLRGVRKNRQADDGGNRSGTRVPDDATDERTARAQARERGLL